MGLAPCAHTLHLFGTAEVISVAGLAQPAALAGRLAGVAATGLAAVMLTLPVAVIRQEQLAATSALPSLGLQTHRGLTPTPEPRE